ncbi:uncharacterized protein COLE_05049 [Cutaneotrichosporon oleaginosum]|nr:hypothetical protein COLE_05049 [Cutaneotrichosporon oleaginosum]
MPPGQYGAGWGQQWQGQPGYGGYPPQPPAAAAAPPTTVPPAATTTAPPPAAAAASAPAPATKGKKSKKTEEAAAAAAAAAATSPVLGKRSSDDGNDEPEKKPKIKKGKKEETKAAPKPPSKSHLKPPRQAPSAWQLFFADELNKAKAAAAAEAGSTPGGTPIHPKLNVAQIAKDAGVAYASLSEDRKAYYARKVEEGKVQYQKDLAAWQATLTPEDIKTENAFRAQQRKDGKSRKGNLKDPNAPKKPLSAYFLFLKGIRENDDLRKSVWADEAETTRQSVLAAERWRGLSDDEKRPYLQQAEKDKQEYEALRKIYEDDAAARQRGEAQSDRPIFKEIESAVINPPKSLLEPRKEGDFPTGSDAPKVNKDGAGTAANSTKTTSKIQKKKKKDDDFSTIPTTTINPASTTFTVALESTPERDTNPLATSGGGFDPTIEMDEFRGFEDMELTGLEAMTGHGEAAEGWDHLGYMDGAEGGDVEAASAAVAAAAAAVERKAKA